MVDIAVLAAAAAIAGATTSAAAPRVVLPWAALTCLFVVAIFALYRVYERDRRQIAVSTLDESKDFLNALSFAALIEIGTTQAIAAAGGPVVPVRTTLLFVAAALVGLPAARGLLRHGLLPLLNTPQNTVIIGAGYVGQTIGEKIRKHPEYNLRIVGFLDDDPQPLRPALDDLPVLGSEDDLVHVLRRYRVARIVLAFSKCAPGDVLELIRNAGLRDVYLSIIPRYFEIMPSNVGVGDVDGIPVLEVPAARLSRLSLFTKRVFDLSLTIPGLILISPLLLLISAAIKLDSPGPVFFRQPRMGRGERTFRIFKFRTMVDGAEQLRSDLLDANECTDGPLFKIREDPRVTRVGRQLRRFSLDELPQLFNVLAGQMSLVGPRPFVVYEDAQIAGWARRRLDLTPGITGLWQVLGRNDIAFDEMVKLDHLYVHNWSLWGDVKLLLRTIPVVVYRRGY
ncbi:MAG TPA: sugar transferase [Gaiellaceae bacterium]|nr:sugar transferase [Gaiellaceae bacterium]